VSIGILAYGRVDDLIAIERSRRARPRPKERTVSDVELRRFKSYARMLAGKYAYRGSGADGQDVEQEAMLTAWRAIRDYRPGDRSLEGYVKERMRWRVVDFVRIRGEGQRRLERSTESEHEPR
jgi:DNA-directed RNA polymerase specialized sigma24 family protein